MKLILKLEHLALIALSVFLFSTLSYPWWWYPLLLLTPDIGMIGYLVNPKIGSIAYNILHFLGLGVLSYIVGLYIDSQIIELLGLIIIGHIGMDRFFGFGLKYPDSFKHTHLGNIGF